MKGLHEHNVIHRDLKLANLLMHNNVIKIADLGFAKKLDYKVIMYISSIGSNGESSIRIIGKYGT
jgi:serine/threonine protein kinase